MENKNYKRIVIIAYRLPFKIITENQKQKLFQNSGGLVSAILSLSKRMKINGIDITEKPIAWIGESEHTYEEFANLESEASNFKLIPVEIPKGLNDKFYGGFCNDTIWPLFHYFSNYAVFREDYFEAYKDANLLFYNTIRQHIKHGDFVWVHDYQLMLLPQMIRSEFANAHIGYFHHIPFPSFEIFRMLTKKWREEILLGLLGADLIGFHTNDYTQHFIRNVRRFLGYDSTLRNINTGDRLVKADSFPIGIDYERFNNAAQHQLVEAEVRKLKKYIKDYKLVFSVDRLDYTKGIMDRLLGFEKFLENYKEWHNKVIFNMVVVPSRDNIAKYQEMKKEIEANVGRINGRFGTIGWRPIIYMYKSLSIVELVALYSISHIGLITPLRDGMNLVAKEYVACQQHNIGVLILSEMAGAVVELGEALIINPIDHKEVADAVAKALDMPEKERKERNNTMKNRIKSYDVHIWADDFIHQLSQVKINQRMLDIKILSDANREELINSYNLSTQRLILLDYDGTLVPFSKFPNNALPSQQLIDLLKHLSAIPNNRVVIISGRDKIFLHKWFGSLNISLVAEHGCFFKSQQGEWERTMDTSNFATWKSKIAKIFDKYVKRCNGAYLEEKEAALVWHYRNADPDFAFVRTQELKDELDEYLSHHKELQLMEGNKIVEVKHAGFDKGSSAKKLIDNYKPDFILAIGDDKTDEDLFKSMPIYAFSIKVGISQTNAKYNLSHQSEVTELLQLL